MNDATHRFFRFSNEQSYEQLTASGNEARGLPDGDGTERWLALWDKTFLDPETNSERPTYNDYSGSHLSKKT